VTYLAGTELDLEIDKRRRSENDMQITNDDQGELSITYPIEKGLVKNWDDLEALW